MTPQEPKKPARPHNVIMENREKLTFCGVLDVDSFDDQTVTVYTELGELTVKGRGLRIENLDTVSGELKMSGYIHGMVYSEQREKSGLLSRLFR